jgi:hypothetical protein
MSMLRFKGTVGNTQVKVRSESEIVRVWAPVVRTHQRHAPKSTALSQPSSRAVGARNTGNCLET